LKHLPLQLLWIERTGKQTLLVRGEKFHIHIQQRRRREEGFMNVARGKKKGTLALLLCVQGREIDHCADAQG
jgi:hypothetical protein